MPHVTHTIIDHSGETSFTRHLLPTITNANYNAITGNAPTQNVGDLRLALAAITNGNFVKHSVMAFDSGISPVVATDPNAQREIKLLVSYNDTNGERGSFEVPCPNLTLLAVAGTDQIDRTGVEWLAFEAAVESFFVSPGGAPISPIVDARIVGRRL